MNFSWFRDYWFTTIVVVLNFVAGIILIKSGLQAYRSAGIQENEGVGIISLVILTLGIIAFIAILPILNLARVKNKIPRSSKVWRILFITLFLLLPVSLGTFFVINSWVYNYQTEQRLKKLYPDQFR